jgi:Ca2+-binding EF-hand superfamily protein
MRSRWIGAFAALVALAAPRADAQTPEIQAAVDAKLAEAKPAAKSADKAEGKPLRAPAIDYLDFVFVASDRPVLVRLHMRQGDRPYSAAWDDYMKKFFDYFDKNGDGKLSKAEVERAPNTQFLQFHLQGSIGFPIQGQMVRLQDMDQNKDGEVVLDEFKDYYRKGGISPLQFFNNNNRTATDRVTSTVFRYLDTNRDGKLSAEEMTRAPEALRRMDLDEDEMLTAAELMPGGDNNNGYFFAVDTGVSRGGPTPEMGFIEIKPGAADAAARQVLTQYDKNKNGKLSREEIGLDKPLFDQLDVNHDGQLDAKEFAAFFRRDADLELIGRLGAANAAQQKVATFLKNIGISGQVLRAEIFNPDKRDMPLAARVKRQSPVALALALGDAHIDLSVSDQAFAQFTNLKQFYTQQFKQADTDKKGVIDMKKARTAQFLDQIFPLADRDGDGKLTEKELTAYLDMQVEGANSQTQLTITDEGRSLFEVLDANGDGRLSIRELRSAWERMKPLAKSTVGLARGDISRRLGVSIGPGQGRRFRAVQVRNGMGRPPQGGNKSAPLWFTKMDRNGDGDISPREFIGRDEDFRKLDADGDGLISVEEARQFEERLKKNKEAKR